MENKKTLMINKTFGILLILHFFLSTVGVIFNNYNNLMYLNTKLIYLPYLTIFQNFINILVIIIGLIAIYTLIKNPLVRSELETKYKILNLGLFVLLIVSIFINNINIYLYLFIRLFIIYAVVVNTHKIKILKK